MKKIIIFFSVFLFATFPVFAEDTHEQTVFEIYIQKQLVVKDNSGFIRAVVNNDVSFIKHLLNQGFNPDTRISGVPAIYFPIYLEREEILNTMLDYGASPNITCFGESPLHFAAYRKSKKCVEILISHGANINKKCLGNSALNIALSKKAFDIAVFLIKNGAVADKKSIKYIRKSNNSELKALSGI